MATDYRWDGKYQRGAMAARRAQKRAEAEARNARTRPEHRKAARR